MCEVRGGVSRGHRCGNEGGVNQRLWNLMYALGNTGRMTGDAGNPQRRGQAISGAKKIAENGWRVWVEHSRSGQRIWDSSGLAAAPWKPGDRIEP